MTEEAFKSLWHDEYGRMYRVAYSMLREPEASKDVVSQAFADLLTRRTDSMADGDLPRNLYRMVCNRCLDLRRRLDAEKRYLSQYSMEPHPEDALNIRAMGDISWRHSEGRMLDFETLNALDFQYGLNGRYTLPRLKTTLSVEATMYSRRGYGSSELNTDDFVLNASLSQSLLKGKFIARIEAFDLLHQLSNTQYAVNAQSRTVTWYRSLPHYVMAHLVFHWNKNPKKRANNKQ